MALEGVDYSETANANWAGLANALKAAGKNFAGRYAVGDKSPGGRGITAAEYAAFKDAGVEVFLYWQTTTNWMLGGWAAGVNGANNAQFNLVAAGMPKDMPVYFACDFDATEGQQAVIDECLRGAASVLGAERVGLYAGYHVLKRAKQNGSAKWFCQTSAWSGGMLMEGVHLYQYAYNQYVYGTNCDWVRAYQENYGQASKFEDGPVIIEPPTPPAAPRYPKDMTKELAQIAFGEYILKLPGGKSVDLHFDPNGPISRAWLDLINDQLKDGQSYRDAVVGPIKKVIRRGTDKRYWDVFFEGMKTLHYDSHERKVIK